MTPVIVKIPISSDPIYCKDETGVCRSLEKVCSTYCEIFYEPFILNCPPEDFENAILEFDKEAGKYIKCDECKEVLKNQTAVNIEENANVAPVGEEIKSEKFSWCKKPEDIACEMANDVESMMSELVVSSYLPKNRIIFI